MRGAVVSTRKEGHLASESELEEGRPTVACLRQLFTGQHCPRHRWADSVEVVVAVAVLLRPLHRLPVHELIRPRTRAVTGPAAHLVDDRVAETDDHGA